MMPFRWNEIRGRSEDEKMQAFLSSDTDMFAIFQLTPTEENRPMAFVSYADLQKRDLKPDHDHYEMVYLAPLPPFQNRETMLEEIYAKFNIDHPEDYTAHSLSVSDVVAIRTGQQVSYHYVDSIGFMELQEFMKPENYLKYAEMSMEDDYGMIDGIINNGKAEEAQKRLEEPEGRKSVLEELRKAKETFCDAPVSNKEREFP